MEKKMEKEKVDGKTKQDVKTKTEEGSKESDEKFKQLSQELETTKKHLENLQKEYKELNSKTASYLNTASYYKNQADETKADFERFKTRNKNIEADAIKKASETTAKKLLPILDGFDQAMISLPQDVMKGFAMIYSSLVTVLKDMGVTEIYPKQKEKLDPTKHNCIDTIETKDKSLDETIAKVYQKGYMFAETGEVIRTATVSVYKSNL